MPLTSKTEFFKYIDCVNSANKDQLTEKAVRKYEELRCLTARALSGRGVEADCSDFETVITTGGSEANCLAIKSILKFYKCKYKTMKDRPSNDNQERDINDYNE